MGDWLFICNHLNGTRPAFDSHNLNAHPLLVTLSLIIYVIKILMLLSNALKI